MADKIKKTIVFDFDGTLTNFEKIDHEIIDKIYGDSTIVMVFDKFLWGINRFEVLKNSMWILQFRLIIYSILSGKDVSKCLKEYKIEYFTKSYKDIKYNYDYYLKYLKKNYRIRVLSNNMFAKGLEYKGIKVMCSTSKMDCIKYFKKRHNIAFVVGNNLFDDVISSNLLNINSVYIGKNGFVKLFAKENFKEINEFISNLKSD